MHLIAGRSAFILRAMHTLADRRARPGPRAWFLTWGWAMLLVVLLSAAPAGAQVRTRLVGSAFDPASVSVALSPKQVKAKAVARPSFDGQPARHADSPPLRATAPKLLSSPPAHHLQPTADPEPLDLPLAHGGLSPKVHGARAPPAA